MEFDGKPTSAQTKTGDVRTRSIRQCCRMERKGNANQSRVKPDLQVCDRTEKKR
ncbi:hypothetical protein HMPREF3213_03774 [Heyndrickxia coagulans]|uniref:Uncharacterized protein n=1 Tax=Heyndrickxia coagulans TaxID=1398 RepID=A0A133KAI8_HEYCO|nr:hypothetical protein HMPREF3213_03774 [Heyndrickxia coagulans]